MSTRQFEYMRLHEEACRSGERTYVDPETGLSVFTRLFHLDRGHCCSSGCRHCPYEEDVAGKSQATVAAKKDT